MIKKLFLTPFQRFVKTESLAGILLFASTIVALIWANSSYGHFYENLWQQTMGISFQNFELKKPLKPMMCWSSKMHCAKFLGKFNGTICLPYIMEVYNLKRGCYVPCFARAVYHGP